MKLIPTPREYCQSSVKSPLMGFYRIDGVLQDDTIQWGIGELCKVFTVPAPDGDALALCRGDDAFFAEKNAAEQGYILTRREKKVELRAQSSVGFLYGLMTLRQMYGDAPEEFTIRDRPQVRFRGNMNTVWAESGVWSYDFGDGLDAAQERLYRAIDDSARAKLNLMYVDAFGFLTERFPGYDAVMKAVSEYAQVRGVRTMIGGYGMGYGQSAHGKNTFMGRVFRNRYPYPDGELYDCIGTCEHDEKQPVSELLGRSYGTCLSNDALTDDKISEIREYLEKTGVSVLYMHNMDADEIHEPLWMARCEYCRERYPSDSLYASDGAAGAFAAFYDRVLEGLLPACPELILCPVSPGYAYAVSTNDRAFEKCRRFWRAVVSNMKRSAHVIPTFRELFYQHEDDRLRFDMLRESMGRQAFGCVFFSGGDGFYSDKQYVPSAALAGTMREADLILCANGGALQKPTQYANAEYLWNTDGSAFYKAELAKNYADFMKQYDDLREGRVHPEGIYGEGGLLETSCILLFGEAAGKRMASLLRLHGKNGEVALFTACSVEIWTRRTYLIYPMRWDKPTDAAGIENYRERFAETALVTHDAADILAELLQSGAASEEDVSYLTFLRDSCVINARLCRYLTRYMDLYRAADGHFRTGTKLDGEFHKNARFLIDETENYRKTLAAMNLRAFDPLGGVILRRDEGFDFISYHVGLILQSLETGKRIPENRRPEPTRMWW